jgi:hypothetical protein
VVEMSWRHGEGHTRWVPPIDAEFLRGYCRMEGMMWFVGSRSDSGQTSDKLRQKISRQLYSIIEILLETIQIFMVACLLRHRIAGLHMLF